MIIPGSIPTPKLHQYLLGSVAPRPIAFVSTKDRNGQSNLAPYSFFNAFSSNPPILVFSSNRRVLDNTTKDTLHNIAETKECVVSVVNHAIVRQMMLCSVDFDHSVNEFEASNLHEDPAVTVAPSLVRESPVNMECRVRDIIHLGEQGGAGHLIICDVLCMHIDESVLDDEGNIDPQKIDLMGRMGKAYYVRASGSAVLSMPQSQSLPIIGYEGLPDFIKQTKLLNANDIATLCGLKKMPDLSEIANFLMQYPQYSEASWSNSQKVFAEAQRLIQTGKSQEALMLLMNKGNAIQDNHIL